MPWAMGCAAEQVEETQVVVLAEGEACAVAREAGVLLNAYRVMVFDFGGADPSADEPPCVDCLRNGRCPLRQQQCVCARPLPPSTVTINRQLEGLRLASIPPDRPYCVGMFGFGIPGLPPPAEGVSEECDCDFGGLEPAVGSCGVSAFPTEVRENSAAIFVSVDCRPGCPMLTR